MSLYYQLLHLAPNCNFCCQCIWFVLDVIDANKSDLLFCSILFYSKSLPLADSRPQKVSDINTNSDGEDAAELDAVLRQIY